MLVDIRSSTDFASVWRLPCLYQNLIWRCLHWLHPQLHYVNFGLADGMTSTCFLELFCKTNLKIFSSDLKKLGEKEMFYEVADLYWLRLVTLLTIFTKKMQLTITICSKCNATFARNKETRSEHMCTLCTRNNFSIFTEKTWSEKRIDWISLLTISNNVSVLVQPGFTTIQKTGKS